MLHPLLLATVLMLTPQDTSMITVPRSILTPQQVEAARVVQYGKYVGLGREIGEAVNSSLIAVTTQANSFAETKVGKITVWLVVWKILGNQLLQVVAAVVWFLTFIPIWLYFLRNVAFDHPVLAEVLPDKTKKYRVVPGDADWKVGMYATFFVGLMIGLVILFA